MDQGGWRWRLQCWLLVVVPHLALPAFFVHLRILEGDLAVEVDFQLLHPLRSILVVRPNTAVVVPRAMKKAWPYCWRRFRINPFTAPESRYAPLGHKLLSIMHRIRVRLVRIVGHFRKLRLLVSPGPVGVPIVEKCTLPSDVGEVLVLAVGLLPFSWQHIRLNLDLLILVLLLYELAWAVLVWVKTRPHVLMNRLWLRQGDAHQVSG